MKIYIKSGYETSFKESNPKTSPDMLRRFAKTNRLSTKRMLAYNPNTPEDVLRELYDTEDDIVKSGLYHNTNTPEDVKNKVYDYFENLGDRFMEAYHISPKSEKAYASSSIYGSREYKGLSGVEGEDLWMLAFDDTLCYIRVIEITEFGTMRYNRVNVGDFYCFIDDNNNLLKDELARTMANEWKDNVHDFDIMEPKEIITTDELIDLIGVSY